MFIFCPKETFAVLLCQWPNQFQYDFSKISVCSEYEIKLLETCPPCLSLNARFTLKIRQALLKHFSVSLLVSEKYLGST